LKRWPRSWPIVDASVNEMALWLAVGRRERQAEPLYAPLRLRKTPRTITPFLTARTPRARVRCLDSSMATPTFHSAGMVHAHGVRPGKPNGTKPLYAVRPHSLLESATVAVHQRRLRNLSVPTSRPSKTASSTPKGNGSRQANCGGIETSVSRGRLPSAASAQFGRMLGRRAASVGREVSVVEPISPVAGATAIPVLQGSGACRSATHTGLVSHKHVAQARSPGVPQFGQQFLAPGR